MSGLLDLAAALARAHAAALVPASAETVERLLAAPDDDTAAVAAVALTLDTLDDEGGRP